MRRSVRFAADSGSIAALIVACGSRTGLELPEAPPAPDGVDGALPETGVPPASIDATVIPPPPLDDAEVPPIVEGGPLDVVTECPDPPTCDPSDPGYVHRCGQRIYQCSSIEQCEVRCTGESCGAQCVDPCQDTLGQDTSNGCDFWALEADTADEAAGVCYAVFVVNQWKTGEPARIQVERGGQVLPIAQFARIPQGKGTNVTYAPYDPQAGLAKDQIAILFLSRDPAANDDGDPASPRKLAACPAGVTPAVQGDAALHGTGIGTAFHIQTNVPVVAYQMLPYGGGQARVTGATLLLPTNVWDTNYVAVNAYPTASGITTDRAQPTLDVVAAHDDTHVTLAPTVDLIAGPGVAAAKAGTRATYTLQRGQYLQVSQPAELTGTPIESDSPVAVVGGSTLLDVPVSRTSRADGAEQMLPPIRALGHEYVAVRFRSRDPLGEESVPWRLVGVAAGTRLTYDPPQPGAPAILGAKQLAEFTAPGPFVVRSQDAEHPFYLAAYMTGGDPYDGAGDPDYVNVIAPEQYLPRYTLFTDPTYPETNLVVVRVRDAATGAFPDVSLDCLGSIPSWSPVDAAGRYQFARVDLSTGDFEAQGGCDNGVHTMTGAFPAGSPATPAFGVTVWGWGNAVTYAPHDDANPKSTRWVSYAYPAGANLKPLNDLVLPAK